MAGTLLYRVFGAGRIPADVLPRIHKEGMLLRDEGVGGSITYRNFRGPGRRHGWKRSWFSGSLVATRRHLLAFAYAKPILGLAWDSDVLSQIQCVAEGPERLVFRYEAALFDAGHSGTVELRYSTAKAREFARIIRRNAARP